jgi:predicted enzyme related to lactoylglutathione lyase
VKAYADRIVTIGTLQHTKIERSRAWAIQLCISRSSAGTPKLFRASTRRPLTGRCKSSAESGINGGVGAGPVGGAGHVTFYVEVADLEAALGKIEDLGGSTVMGSTEVPGGTRIAMFTDPEGHLVGLIKADSS